MKSWRLSLIHAGIALWAVSSWAQQAPPAPVKAAVKTGAVDQTPSELALSAEMEGFLAKALGGEDQLWLKVAGAPKLPNQTLEIFVPSAAIKLGDLVYSPKARFKVQSETQSLDNCVQPWTDGQRPPPPLRRQVQSVAQVTNTGTWSTVRSKEHQSDHALSISATVHFPLGIGSVTSTYDFSKLETSRIETTTGQEVQKIDTLSIDTTLKAGALQSVVYQSEVVMLEGDQAPYKATAEVNSNAPIRFVVQTDGFTPAVAFMARGGYIPALDNTRPLGSNVADDVYLGDKVVVSNDGAYVFGRERGTGMARAGTYSVVDFPASNATTLSRIWSPLTNNTCGLDMDLVLTAEGKLQIRCGSAVRWDAGVSTAKGNPCYYLAFLGNRGELACYNQNPNLIVSDTEKQAAWKAPVYSTKSTSKVAEGATAQPFSIEKKFTLAELIGRPTHEFVFSGQYSGNQVVSGPTYCSFTYELVYQPKTGACLVQDPNTGAQTHKTAGTQNSAVAKRRFCPKTQEFLTPFLARNPLLLAQ